MKITEFSVDSAHSALDSLPQTKRAQDESLDQLNKDIIAFNDAVKAKYLKEKSREIAELLRKPLTSLTSPRERSAGDSGVKQEFVEGLTLFLNQVMNLLSLAELTDELGPKRKETLGASLRKLQTCVREAVTHKNWIFREGPETDEVMRRISALLVEIRVILINSKKGCAAFCSPGMKKEFDAKVEALGEQVAFFCVLFRLKSRFAPNVDSSALCPSFSVEEWGRRVEEILSHKFPALEPLQEIREVVRYKEKVVHVPIASPKPAAEGAAAPAAREDSSSLLKAAELFYGFGRARDLPAALKLFEKNAAEGRSPALHYLGKAYQSGIGVASCPAKAFGYFEEGARRGHPACLYDAGKCVEQGAARPELSAVERTGAAMQYYEKAAAKGHGDAACDLGFIYEQGLNGIVSRERAEHFYGIAVNLGNPRAMNNLAGLLLGGPGAAGERARAFELYSQSAAAGYEKGVTNLGVCYLKGIHVPADVINARSLFERAAALKETEAMFYTAYFALREGMLAHNEQGLRSAFKTFQEVAELNPQHSDAHFYLAYFFENGLVVEQSLQAALGHLAQAAAANPGNAKALKKMGQLLVESGEEQRGKELLRKAQELESDEPVAAHARAPSSHNVLRPSNRQNEQKPQQSAGLKRVYHNEFIAC